MRKLHIETIENLALKFRVECGLSDKEAIHVKNLLRRLDILALFRPLSEEFYGMALQSPKGEKFMLINSNSTIGRQHFTIAHELYHLYFEDNIKWVICKKESEPKNVSEHNANLFASAFLMPKTGIFDFITHNEIKTKNISLAKILKIENHFSVSHIAMLIRLKTLNLLSDNYFDEHKDLSIKEIAKNNGYDTELYDKGNEYFISGSYREKANVLFQKQKISEGHYNEIIGLISNE
jgi:Zn-dependent peptidase ImmA (M78 family)